MRSARGAQRFVGFFSWLCFSDADSLGEDKLRLTWLSLGPAWTCQFHFFQPSHTFAQTQGPGWLPSINSWRIKDNTGIIQRYFITDAHYTISYPETSSFLLRMLDENEGLWKGPILRRSWLVLWNVIQYNKSAMCGLLEPVLSRALHFCRECAVRS